eukprot:1159036-Pelagomonas_calceolata.AAC.15
MSRSFQIRRSVIGFAFNCLAWGTELERQRQHGFFNESVTHSREHYEAPGLWGGWQEDEVQQEAVGGKEAYVKLKLKTRGRLKNTTRQRALQPRHLHLQKFNHALSTPNRAGRNF